MSDNQPNGQPGGVADLRKAESATPDGVYGLRELIDPEALRRMTRTFAKLCSSRIAVCDVSGQRLDRLTESDRPIALPPEKQARYSAAITCDDRTLGRVVVLEAQPDEQTRELADLLASIIGAQGRQEMQIRRRVRELTTVYDLGGLFAGTRSLDTVLNIAAKRICDVINAKAAAVRILDEETGELIMSGTHNLSQEYLDKGRLMVEENSVDVAALSGQVVYIEDVQTDPRVRYPQAARREGLVSGLSCPMIYRGRTVGIIRVYMDRKYRFSPFEVELLRAVGAQAAGAIVNSRLFKDRLEADGYRRQVRYAGDIQRRMIPRQSPRHSRISFGRVYEPSFEVGGDFFDIIEFSDGSVGLVIADVVGKGIPAALMGASVRSSLRAHAHSIYDINEIVALVNRDLCRDTLLSEFVTLCYGVFSADGGRFTYCNAGHSPPLLVRGDQFRSLETGGTVIGVLPEAAFDRDLVDLQSGDHLLFYTDGVTEALDFSGQPYGEKRFRDSIIRHRHLEVCTFANQLLWDVRRFAGLAGQTDDITIVVARVN